MKNKIVMNAEFFCAGGGYKSFLTIGSNQQFAFAVAFALMVSVLNRNYEKRIYFLISDYPGEV